MKTGLRGIIETHNHFQRYGLKTSKKFRREVARRLARVFAGRRKA